MNRSCLVRAVMVGGLVAFGGKEYPELSLRITDETAEHQAARLDWWRDARFGMFIHFGLYSVPGRHEWVKFLEAIDTTTYDKKYLSRFNPDLFDAKEWVRTAKRAGMKYIVLTVKHHEGFCMWDTATTDYKITNTEFGRDLVREYVDACRAEGMRVGFYFSIKDWHHPDFTVDWTHPQFRKLWLHDRLDGEPLKAAVAKLNEGRDMGRYRKYMFDQIKEILTNYGKIDIIWFDYTQKHETFGKSYKDYDSVNLVKLTRQLQPDIIMDNRLDLMDTDDGWDFVTPEQFKVQTWPTVRGRKVPWETCQTFSGSWGYHRDEESWKSVHQVIELLIHSVSKGGNLIMNVGPTARGEFDDRAMDRLDGYAKWMRRHGRSIYGCGLAPEDFVAPNGTALTYNPKTQRLYIHLLEYPLNFLPLEFFDKIEYAQLLNDGSELKLRAPVGYRDNGQAGEQVGELGGICLPVKKPAVEIPVIEVWLKK